MASDDLDYRRAGETILGRADWGDRESDYDRSLRRRLPTGEEGGGRTWMRGLAVATAVAGAWFMWRRARA